MGHSLFIPGYVTSGLQCCQPISQDPVCIFLGSPDGLAKKPAFPSAIRRCVVA